MRHVVFDIETRNDFASAGSPDPSALEISIVCAYDSESDSYHSFLVEELPKLWPILEKTELLIGFNSDKFDIPILNKYYPGDLTLIKSLDLLSEIRDSIGRRIKLDSIAEATLGKKKSGSGLQAITWWRDGDIERLRNYCLDDVKITKELYEYALTNGKLLYKDMGILKDILLPVSKWGATENGKLTQTLPF